jgi:hypothetical protein
MDNFGLDPSSGLKPNFHSDKIWHGLVFWPKFVRMAIWPPHLYLGVLHSAHIMPGPSYVLKLGDDYCQIKDITVPNQGHKILKLESDSHDQKPIPMTKLHEKVICPLVPQF